MDFSGMLKGMQSKMQEVKEKKEKARFTGESGGAMVKITMDGNLDIKEIKIGDSLKGEDFDIIADLIIAAYNNAKKAAEENDEFSEENLMNKFPFPFKPPF